MATTVEIIKKNKYEPGEFGQFSMQGFSAASQKLSKNGIILWLYLCNNKAGYKFTLSPTAISNELGVSENVAKNMTRKGGAVEELTKYGFIKDGKFYADGPEIEKPSEKNENSSEKAGFNF